MQSGIVPELVGSEMGRAEARVQKMEMCGRQTRISELCKIKELGVWNHQSNKMEVLEYQEMSGSEFQIVIMSRNQGIRVLEDQDKRSEFQKVRKTRTSKN